MDDATANALLVELRHMNRLLRELPAGFAVALAAHNRGGVSVQDRAVLDTLLAPLLEAMGQAVFTLRDLDEQAQTYDALRKALQQLKAQGLSGRKLGKLFARIAGADLGGVVLWQRGQDRDGLVWQLVRV